MAGLQMPVGSKKGPRSLAVEQCALDGPQEALRPGDLGGSGAQQVLLGNEVGLVGAGGVPDKGEGVRDDVGAVLVPVWQGVRPGGECMHACSMPAMRGMHPSPPVPLKDGLCGRQEVEDAVPEGGLAVGRADGLGQRAVASGLRRAQWALSVGAVTHIGGMSSARARTWNVGHSGAPAAGGFRQAAVVL